MNVVTVSGLVWSFNKFRMLVLLLAKLQSVFPLSRASQEGWSLFGNSVSALLHGLFTDGIREPTCEAFVVLTN